MLRPTMAGSQANCMVFVVSLQLHRDMINRDVWMKQPPPYPSLPLLNPPRYLLDVYNAGLVSLATGPSRDTQEALGRPLSACVCSLSASLWNRIQALCPPWLCHKDTTHNNGTFITHTEAQNNLGNMFKIGKQTHTWLSTCTWIPACQYEWKQRKCSSTKYMHICMVTLNKTPVTLYWNSTFVM